MHDGKFDADRRRERAREMREEERERERERAVCWACVTGALIKWASLFVSWHRRFVFGRTDTD
jgi:hypothetical protein